MAPPTNRQTYSDTGSRADVRAALVVSLQSIGWTFVASCASIALGVARSSTALGAFGAIGLVDAIGSAALVHHFRHGLGSAGLADHRERLAHLVVLVGLLVVGTGAIAVGAVRLAEGRAATSDPFGTGLAAVSLIVLTLLARRKIRVAKRVGSPALRSDGRLSGLGAVQAAVTVAGAGTTMLGWTWTDPAAAMTVGSVAVAVGIGTWRSEMRRR